MRGFEGLSFAEIAEHCDAVDIIGANVYRGTSSRDLFDEVKEKLDRPFMYTEFGADAYNAKEKRGSPAMPSSGIVLPPP